LRPLQAGPSDEKKPLVPPVIRLRLNAFGEAATLTGPHQGSFFCVPPLLGRFFFNYNYMCRAIIQLFDLKIKAAAVKEIKSAAALEVFHYVLLLACNCNISKRSGK